MLLRILIFILVILRVLGLVLMWDFNFSSWDLPKFFHINFLTGLLFSCHIYSFSSVEHLIIYYLDWNILSLFYRLFYLFSLGLKYSLLFSI